MPTKKKIVILGATGSIGTSALRVIEKHADKLELIGVSTNRRYRELAAITQQFNVPAAAISDETAYTSARLDSVFPDCCELHAGPESLTQLATLSDADLVLIATVGTSGLYPCLAAIQAGKTIALANKEVLVMAGAIVMEAVSKHNTLLLPTDSEHNAIFQCLHDPDQSLPQVEKLILTASGGPFRSYTLEDMAHVTLEAALRHPNWDMGPKVTIDSATMANKGLELIEARWLYGIPVDQLEVVVHPPSIVHSMVQFVDGSVLAQLSPPSMTFPIQHCLLYPERAAAVDPALDFSQALSLEFFPPDYTRFPCLALARESLRQDKSASCVFNAANEVAVAAFIDGKLDYLGIPRVIDKTLQRASIVEPSSLDAVLEADREARAIAQGCIPSS